MQEMRVCAHRTHVPMSVSASFCQGHISMGRFTRTSVEQSSKASQSTHAQNGGLSGGRARISSGLAYIWQRSTCSRSRHCLSCKSCSVELLVTTSRYEGCYGAFGGNSQLAVGRATKRGRWPSAFAAQALFWQAHTFSLFVKSTARAELLLKVNGATSGKQVIICNQV